MDINAFSNPERIYRGTDFWMLNDSLPDEDIIFQIKEMKEKGAFSFIARTYIGLKSDYPGPAFKKKMHLIVDTARQYGLKVFLQAGYMPEAVPDIPEEYAIRFINPIKKSEEIPEGDIIMCQNGDYTFTEHNSRTFLNMLNKQAVEYYLLKSYEEMWQEFSDEYGKTILSVWVDEPSYNGSYLPWTPDFAEKFMEKYGFDIREKVYLLYEDREDEDYKKVRYMYRTMIRDMLEYGYFEPVRKWCHAHNLLFSGHLMMEDTLTSQISRAGAIMPYYKYFDIPGIDVLCGYMNWQDSPIQPGDRNVVPHNLYTTALQCTSAAAQAGKEHILAEMYGVVSENMTFRNQLYMFDSYAALGINHRSVHGIFFSLGGRGKRAYPPHVNYYQPYWEKYADVYDYVARVSSFISRGSAVSDVLVVHPLETAFMYYAGSLKCDFGNTSKRASAYNDVFFRTVHSLVSSQLCPQLGDASTLEGDMTHVEGGRIVVGKMSYKVMILPNIEVISSKLLGVIEAFAKSGGKLFILGNAPTRLDGVYDDTLAQRLTSLPGVTLAGSNASLVSSLQCEKPYELSGQGANNILVNFRRDGDGENFFLANTDCAKKARLNLTVKGLRTAFICNAFDGSITRYTVSYNESEDTSTVSIKIPCGDSVAISLEYAKQGDKVCRTAENETPLSIDISDGDYTLTPDRKNVLYLDKCRYRTEQMTSLSKELPILAIHKLLTDADYHGKLTLSYVINAVEALDNLTLAIERPENSTIILNGVVQAHNDYGYFCAKQFRCVKLTDGLKKGVNTLEIESSFVPLSKATSAINSLFETQLGCELEPIYLLGDFYVNVLAKQTINGYITCESIFTLSPLPEKLTSTSEIATSGFPFYMGKMVMTKVFELSESQLAGIICPYAKLSVGTINAAVCEVYLNGKSLGDLSRPGELDVDVEGCLVAGENKLEIVLYNTLRNIVGPFHRPLGEVGNLFGGGYKNLNAAWLNVDTETPGWENRISESYTTWTDDYNIAPYGADNISLKFRG